MTQTQSRTQVTSVANVLVPVADQDRAIEFYVGTLGFEKRVDVGFGEGNRWVEVGPVGGETNIALCYPVPQDAWTKAAHCAFYSDDATVDHAYLKERGVDVDDIMPGGGPVPPMFFFRDVDGNSLLIVQRQA